MQSALYGLALSLLICVAAVAVFTTHVLLLLPVLLSILGTWAAAKGPAGGWPSASGFLPARHCRISSALALRPTPP